MAGTKQRLIDGPDSDYLEASEVAAYLRVEPKTLRRMVARGEFPRPIEVSPQTRVWSWRDVVGYLLWMEVKHRLRADSEGTTADNDGQRGTTRDK